MADPGPLLDAGYFPKLVAYRPEYPHPPAVSHVLSVSHHISLAPDGWIETWRHNELGFFNRLADARAIVPPGDAGRYRLFAYRILPQVFVKGEVGSWERPADVRPEPVPADFAVLGFDAVSRFAPDVLGFECSPLSCNGLASETTTTDGCLYPTLEAAIAGARQFAREQPEPGDYYVVQVLGAPPAA